MTNEDCLLAPICSYGIAYPVMTGSSFSAVLSCLRIRKSQVLLQVCLGI